MCVVCSVYVVCVCMGMCACVWVNVGVIECWKCYCVVVCVVCCVYPCVLV